MIGCVRTSGDVSLPGEGAALEVGELLKRRSLGLVAREDTERMIKIHVNTLGEK